MLAVHAHEAGDVAVLVLAEPAPAAVRSAPLSSPDGTDLAGERWWAFGFPADTPFGADAHGVIGASLAYGWMRLEADPGQRVTGGFIGAGIWSPRFEAVVGLLGRVHPMAEPAGHAVAMTLAEVARELPGERLDRLAGWTALDAGESALAAWGWSVPADDAEPPGWSWSLDADVEAGRHWRPRARGVPVESEPGYRFRGRRAALAAVIGWLDRAVLDDRVLVVTGSPGVGKSAVLGRVVTTADAALRRALPPDDDNLTAAVGSVACAVHVKGKTALDVAVEIARAAAVRLPDSADQLAPALRRRLADRHTPRFTVVLDALDEAVTPDQAQQVVEDIVLPIARTCGPVGAQLVVGTRRSDDGGDLMQLFGSDPAVVDLDDERYFEVGDLTAYALATLRLVGAEREGNPYADERVAGPVAARIAELADRNFLVAGLTARRHGQYDAVAVHPDDLCFPPDVDTALAAYVRRLPPVGAAPATLALTALAYAQGSGLSLELWQVVLAALGATTQLTDLAEFARTSAANFLVESTGHRFRLFHQALDDALLRDRQQRRRTTGDQRAISERLIRYGRNLGWAGADRYLLGCLPEHAAAGGVIDELLVDDTYLLHADLLRLIPPADYARTILGQQRARLLRLTPQAAGAAAAERAAMFSVTAALEGLDARMAVDRDAPYRAAWAAVQRRSEWAVLEGHSGAAGVVCALTTRARRTVLASGGNDGTVRIWDPQSGQPTRTMLAGSAVAALCPITVDGRTLVASAGADGVVVLWDPESGGRRHTLHCAPGQIRALTPADRPGAQLLGVASTDGTLTLWDPVGQTAPVYPMHSGKITRAAAAGGDVVAGGEDGSVLRWDARQRRTVWSVAAHRGPVTALSRLPGPAGDLVATAGADQTIRLWDARTGAPRSFWRHASGTVEALAVLLLHGTVVLVSADSDGTVRLWDPATGHPRGTLPSRSARVRDLCGVQTAGRVLLASVGDAAVRLWDPEAHDRRAAGSVRSGQVTAVAPIWQGSREMVASGLGDGLIELRHVSTGLSAGTLTGHGRPITGLSTVFAGGEVMLASSSGGETVRLWTLSTSRRWSRKAPPDGWSSVVAAVFLHRQVYLACAGEAGTVRLFDPYSGKERRRRRFRPWRRPDGHTGPIGALCALNRHGGAWLASAGHDATVRVWDLRTGRTEAVFDGHKGRVRALCGFTLRGRELIASAGDDQIVRVWDAATGVAHLSLTGHTGRITAVCPVTAGGRLLLASAGHDRTARLWNPVSGTLELTVPVHHEATSCTASADRLIVGLTAGTLALRLDV